MLWNDKILNKAFCVTLLLVALSVITAFGEESGIGETVVAAGDGFRLTQKVIDEYRSAIAPDTGQPTNKKGLLAAILKYEMLSREYFQKQKEMGVATPLEEPLTIEMKVHAANKYIQQVLSDYPLRDDVVESYYRSYPEKYKIKNAPDGGISLLPLDDNLKKEIKFIIIEKRKKAIVEETVQNLLLKYKIQVINDYY